MNLGARIAVITGAIMCVLAIVGAIVICAVTGTEANIWYTIDGLVGFVGLVLAFVIAPVLARRT